MEKITLRKEMRARIARLDDGQKQQQSAKLCCTLKALLSDIKKDAIIMCYSALDDEIDISEVVSFLWNRGIKTVFPLVYKNEMHLRFVSDYMNDLQAGYQGIREPKQTTLPCDAKDVEVVLVPGVAFDMSGGRLGRGKGFYDRFLGLATQAQTIGCAFDIQEVAIVPMQEHDHLLDKVIFSCSS